eukprot:10638663-Lingulodinium_polyedra.AAC.1
MFPTTAHPVDRHQSPKGRRCGDGTGREPPRVAAGCPLAAFRRPRRRRRAGGRRGGGHCLAS